MFSSKVSVSTPHVLRIGWCRSRRETSGLFPRSRGGPCRKKGQKLRVVWNAEPRAWREAILQNPTVLRWTLWEWEIKLQLNQTKPKQTPQIQKIRVEYCIRNIPAKQLLTEESPITRVLLLCAPRGSSWLAPHSWKGVEGGGLKQKAFELFKACTNVSLFRTQIFFCK